MLHMQRSEIRLNVLKQEQASFVDGKNSQCCSCSVRTSQLQIINSPSALTKTNGCNHCRCRRASSSPSRVVRPSGFRHLPHWGTPSPAATFRPCNTRAHGSFGEPSGLPALRAASRGSTGAATADLVAHRLGAQAAYPAVKLRSHSHSHSQESSNQESI